MEIITDITALRERLQEETSIAFVPTMGNLHAGHLSLVQLAQQRASCVVVSIFVNRLQFAPHEDYERYPRTPQDDCCVLEELGVEVASIASSPIFVWIINGEVIWLLYEATIASAEFQKNTHVADAGFYDLDKLLNETPMRLGYCCNLYQADLKKYLHLENN